jgi:GTP-binding protein Era
MSIPPPEDPSEAPPGAPTPPPVDDGAAPSGVVAAAPPGGALSADEVEAAIRALSGLPPMHPDHRFGSVALVGRPNAGKSTLLNTLLGEKLAAVSARPQTTRTRFMGIRSYPDMQLVLLDTPGLHKATSPMNLAMVKAARQTLTEADVCCWVLDAVPLVQAVARRRRPLDGAPLVIAAILESEARGPIVIALNKVDKVEKPALLPVMAALTERLPKAEIVPISAARGVGIDSLVKVWRARLPVGPPMYPADTLTDATERAIVAELIREKLFCLTREELPYATAVEIEKFDEAEPLADGRRGGVVIFARILVERDGQKAIVIGKGGEMLKNVGTQARVDVEAFLGTRAHLELHVTVQRDWTRDPRALQELGLDVRASGRGSSR